MDATTLKPCIHSSADDVMTTIIMMSTVWRCDATGIVLVVATLATRSLVYP